MYITYLPVPRISTMELASINSLKSGRTLRAFMLSISAPALSNAWVTRAWEFRAIANSSAVKLCCIICNLCQWVNYQHVNTHTYAQQFTNREVLAVCWRTLSGVFTSMPSCANNHITFGSCSSAEAICSAFH